MKRSRIYQVLSLLLFAGLLASCSDVSQQEVVEEQSTDTYAFSAQTSSGLLSGELTLIEDGRWDDYGGDRDFSFQSFDAQLRLEDGTQVSGPAFLRNGDVSLYLSNRSGQYIRGGGQANVDGSLSGGLNGRVSNQLVTGSWTATPMSGSGNTPDPTPPDDGDDGNPPPSNPGDSGQGNLTVNILSSPSNVSVAVTAELVGGGDNSSVSLSGSSSSSSGGDLLGVIDAPASAGEYLIKVSGEGVVVQDRSITVDPGEDKVVNITL